MKSHLLTCFLMTGFVFAQGEPTPWLHDFDAAKAKAKAEQKFLLVNFAGTGWNSWSNQLQRELFGKQEFVDGVAEHFLLVRIDYPRDRSKAGGELTQQSARLERAYAIDDLPTLLLMDHDGLVFEQLPRSSAGPDEVLTMLDQMFRRGLRFKAARQAAETVEGLARAEALVECLRTLDPALVRRYHIDTMQRIVDLDADGKGGLRARYQARLREIREEHEAKVAGDELRQLIKPHTSARNVDAAIAQLDAMIAAPKDRIWHQQALLLKAMLLRTGGERLDEAVRLVEEVRRLAPNSPVAKQADRVLPGLRHQAEVAATVRK